VREDVHVSEAVYGQYRQVVGRLTQVVKGVGELGAVRRQEVDGTWGGNSSTVSTHSLLYGFMLLMFPN